jgi:hypothetical protein
MSTDQPAAPRRRHYLRRLSGSLATPLNGLPSFFDGHEFAALAAAFGFVALGEVARLGIFDLSAAPGMLLSVSGVSTK